MCWDADRLDLPRVGITPDPNLMSTDAGRREAATAAKRVLARSGFGTARGQRGGWQAPGANNRAMTSIEALPSTRLALPGPFSHHDVVIDGWRVPFLHAHLAGEDRVMVVLDRRLAVELNAAEAERILPFVADAIAVALGYGAHPRAESPRPPERAPYPRPERVVEVIVPPSELRTAEG